MQTPQHANPNQVVMIVQIITIALVMGVLLFLGIVVMNTQDQQPGDPEAAYPPLIFSAVAILVQFFVRIPVPTNRLKELAASENFDPRSDEVFAALAPQYQVELIIKLAILEMPAFYNGIVYMQEKIWWNLAAMGLSAVLMLAMFPTHSRLESWIERKTLPLRFGEQEF